MSKHTQRVLDHQYQVAMAKKVKSQDPIEAAIGRQGQAIRQSCIDSKKASIVSSVSSANLSHDHRDGPLSRVTSNLTEITEPDTEELIDKLFGGVPKWQPGSFGRDPNSRRNLSYDNILGEGPISSRPSKPIPSEREEGPHEHWMRVYGSYMRGEGNDKEHRSYNQLSLKEQRQRIKAAQDAKNINMVLHFPEWKTEYKGAGKYRMAADFSTEVTNQRLIDAMGSTADILGLEGNVELEGYEGTTFDDLLGLKFEKEIQRKLKAPREETVDGVKVVRGFPIPEERQIRVANVYHNPFTFAALGDLQTWGQASNWRLMHHHFWTGHDHHQKQPEELNLVETYPQPPIHDDPNVIPKPVGFTKFSGPEFACLPDRHPAIKHSDLEALKPLKDASPIRPPQQPKARPIAITKESSSGPRVRVQVPARPAMQRRISDRGQKAQKANKKLGKKRVVSAIEVSQPKQPEKPVHSAATSRLRQEDKTVLKAATTSKEGEKPAEYQDSPPAELLVTPPTEFSYASTKVQPAGPITFSKASRNDSGYSSGKSSLTQLIHAASQKVTQSSTPSIPEKPSSTLGQPEIPLVKITISSSSPTIESKSASVEKRNENLADKSQKRITWDPNVISKVSIPRAKAQADPLGPYPSPGYIYIPPAKPQAPISNTGAHPMSFVGTAPTMKRRDRGMIAELAASSARDNEPLSKTYQHSSAIAQSPNVPKHDIPTTFDDLPAVPSHEPARVPARLPNIPERDITTATDELPAAPNHEPSAVTDEDAWDEVA